MGARRAMRDGRRHLGVWNVTSHLLRYVVLAALLAGPAGAQTPSFEVASIKPHTASGPPRPRVSIVPASGSFSATAVTVRDIVLAAYVLQRFELVDDTSPILSQRIDILAKAAPGATVAQMQRML